MKRPNITRLTAVLAAFMLLCTLFTGCTGDGEESSRTGPDVQSGETSDVAGDGEAEDTLIEACKAGGATEDSISKAVHSAYTTMKMILA